MSLPKNAQEIVDFVADHAQNVDDVLETEMLWARRATGKWGYWQMSVGIVDAVLEPGDIDKKDTEGSWQDDLGWLPITQELIEREDLEENTYAVYWTVSGQEGGKQTVSKPTFVTTGKNIGRSNYTTAFTQAIRTAMTQYNAKVRKGQITSDQKKFIKKPGETYTMEELIEATHRGDAPWRVHVMTLHDVEKNKNWKHIKYPLYIQPKINGTHFVVVQHPDLPEKEIQTDEKKSDTTPMTIDWYSRGREEFASQDHIFAELWPALQEFPGLHVTGELWLKGQHLQDISGSARRIDPEKKKGKTSKRKKTVKQEFHIFDVFYIDQPDMPFKERLSLIDNLFATMDEKLGKPPQWCKKVETFEVETREELDAHYKDFLDNDYEGAVLRNVDSPYEVGVDKPKRSYQTMKLKPRPDADWPVVDFTDGKRGKDVGAIKWVCSHEGKDFNVTPNWTYEVRYEVYKALTENEGWFEDNLKNKLAVLQYSELSKEGKPQQPKFLQFKDADLEQSLMELAGIE